MKMEKILLFMRSKYRERKPDINDPQTKNEIELVNKNKFDYNKKLLEQIRDEKFTDTSFLQLEKEEIQTLTINHQR